MQGKSLHFSPLLYDVVTASRYQLFTLPHTDLRHSTTQNLANQRTVAAEGAKRGAARLSTPPNQAGRAPLYLATRRTPGAQRGVAPLVALVKQEYSARRPRAIPSQALLHRPVGARQGVVVVVVVAVAAGTREAVEEAGIRAAAVAAVGIQARRLKKPLRTPGEVGGGQALNGTRPQKMLLLALRIAAGTRAKNLPGLPGEMPPGDGARAEAQLRAASLSPALDGGSPRLVRSRPHLGGGRRHLGGGSPHLVRSSPRPVGEAPRNHDLHAVHPQSHTALPGVPIRRKVISVRHRGELTFPPRRVLTSALHER